MIPLAPTLAVPGHPGYLSGSYYTSPLVTGTNQGAVAANTLYIEPFVIYEPVAIDRVGASVQTGSAGNMKLGIFRINQNGSASLIAENNADISTAVAADFEGSFSANPTLSPGWYGMASCYSGTPTVRWNAIGNVLATAFVGGAAMNAVSFSGGGAVIGWSPSLTYSAGASFFPTSIAAASMTRGVFTPIPRHYFRKA